MPKRIFFVLLILTISSLACSLSGNTDDGTQFGPPGGAITVNQEAAERLKQNFNQAMQEAGSNHESQLRITNEEITSLVGLELAQTGQIPVTEPQIWFTSGRIYMTSKVQLTGPVKLDSIIVGTAVVDNGQMALAVEEAQMGPFDFPDQLLETTTQTVNETVAGIMVGANLTITRLEILEGEMFVIGTRNQGG
jgi:hypothetical protein